MVKNKSLENRRNGLVILGLIFVVIFMFIGLIILVMASNTFAAADLEIRELYKAGTITKDEALLMQKDALDAQTQLQNIGLGVYLGGMFGSLLFFGMFAMVIWVQFKDFKAEQAGKDIFETILKGYKNTYKYQIETPRDSCKPINAIDKFLEIVRKTQTFISLVDRIKLGGNDIVFDHADILKEVMVIFEEEKNKKKIPKAAVDEDDKEQDKVDPNLEENFISLLNPDRQEARAFLIKMEFYRQNIDPEWNLMFRPIDRILCLDANDTSLENVKGMYYLMPGKNEKEYFNFPIRTSNDEYQIPIGKCYVKFRFIKHILGDKFLFLIYDDNPDDSIMDLKISGSKVDQSELKALGQFAYLVYTEQESKQNQLGLKESEIAKYKSDKQNFFADGLEQFIDEKGTGGLANRIEHRIQNKPIQVNFGLIVLMAVMFAIGFLVCKTWFVPIDVPVVPTG